MIDVDEMPGDGGGACAISAGGQLNKTPPAVFRGSEGAAAKATE